MSEDPRVTHARKTLADTEVRPNGYGSAYAQRTESRIALELLLEVVDDQAAQLAGRHADGESMDRYRAYMDALHRDHLAIVYRIPREIIRRPVRRP